MKKLLITEYERRMKIAKEHAEIWNENRVQIKARNRAQNKAQNKAQNGGRGVRVNLHDGIPYRQVQSAMKIAHDLVDWNLRLHTQAHLELVRHAWNNRRFLDLFFESFFLMMAPLVSLTRKPNPEYLSVGKLEDRREKKRECEDEDRSTGGEIGNASSTLVGII